MRTPSLPTRQAPPVLVMNLYYTGIGIGRSLRASGVAVHGLSSEKDAPGARSRLFSRVHQVPYSRDDPEALCQRLQDIRREYPYAPVIFPTCDSDVLFLAQFSERLADSYRIPPGLSALPQLMDKLGLARLAERVSIPAPRTRVCASEQEVDQAGLTLAFPAVVKPRSAHEWRKRGVWDRVGGRKAILVDSAAELLSTYRELAPVSAEVLVQEYVPGDDSDIVVCCCYIDEHGDLLGHFTGRKLRQNPPLFGTGCLVEASEVPEIVSLSQRLLKGCGYIGLAEVEFKRDTASGRYMLIEVNPRHWDQHELGRLVGVNLTWIAYRKAIGLDPDISVPHYDGHQAPRWIAERDALFLIARNALAQVGETSGGGKVRFSVLKVGAKTVIELKRLIRRPFVLSIISIKDPLASVLFCSKVMRELFALARQVRNKKT